MQSGRASGTSPVDYSDENSHSGDNAASSSVTQPSEAHLKKQEASMRPSHATRMPAEVGSLARGPSVAQSARDTTTAGSYSGAARTYESIEAHQRPHRRYASVAGSDWPQPARLFNSTRPSNMARNSTATASLSSMISSISKKKENKGKVPERVFQLGGVFPEDKRRQSSRWPASLRTKSTSGNATTPECEKGDPFDELEKRKWNHRASSRPEQEQSERDAGEHDAWRDEDQTPVDSIHEDDGASLQQGGRSRDSGGDTEQIGGPMQDHDQDWINQWPDDTSNVISTWSGIRYTLREPLAEFLGMLVLVCIGVASDCQVAISDKSAGTYSSQNFSWGIGVMAGIYVSGGVSGGHLNPALTIALAFFRGFPWRMVPRYIVAQVLGAFCAACIVWGNYKIALNSYDSSKNIYVGVTQNATAPLFVTVPNVTAGGTVPGFFQELLATAILSIVVLALGDENNAPPGAGLGAVVLGLVVTAIGMSMGFVSGYALNPARDFGARLALWAVGFGSKLWTHDSCWWIPICGPIVGALIGCLVYDIAIFEGTGSPVNSSSTELKHALRIPTIHHNMVRMRLFGRSDVDSRKQAHAEATLEAGRHLRHDLRKRQGKLKDEQKRVDVQERWKKARKKVAEQEQAHKERKRQRVNEIVQGAQHH
ncbi:hypothetical protein ACM66B_004402 [Microbotryomycetes sp. NB124-2]